MKKKIFLRVFIFNYLFLTTLLKIQFVIFGTFQCLLKDTFHGNLAKERSEVKQSSSTLLYVKPLKASVNLGNILSNVSQAWKFVAFYVSRVFFSCEI